MRAFAVDYWVEFSGTSPSMDWEGTVKALNMDQALVLGAVKATREGVMITDETRIRITREE